MFLRRGPVSRSLSLELYRLGCEVAEVVVYESRVLYEDYSNFSKDFSLKIRIWEKKVWWANRLLKVEGKERTGGEEGREKKEEERRKREYLWNAKYLLFPSPPLPVSSSLLFPSLLPPLPLLLSLPPLPSFLLPSPILFWTVSSHSVNVWLLTPNQVM